MSLFDNAAEGADPNCTVCRGHGTVEVPDPGHESASTEYCHCWWKSQPLEASTTNQEPAEQQKPCPGIGEYGHGLTGRIVHWGCCGDGPAIS